MYGYQMRKISQERHYAIQHVELPLFIGFGNSTFARYLSWLVLHMYFAHVYFAVDEKNFHHIINTSGVR